MKLYEPWSIILSILLAIGWSYSAYTADDLNDLRQFVKKYSQDVKNEWVKKREKCIEKSEYKENDLCQFIKKHDNEARKLWKKLKKADDKAEAIQQSLKRLQYLRKVINQIK